MKQIISIKALLLTVLMTTVVGNVWGNDKYVKVTSLNDIVEGDEYIIAAVVTLNNKVLTYVATAWDGTTQLSSTKTGFDVNGNTITVTTSSPMKFTLGKKLPANQEDPIIITLKMPDDYYLGFAQNNDLEKAGNANSNKEQWTYTYDQNKKSYVIVNVNTNSRLLALTDIKNEIAPGYFKAYVYSSSAIVSYPIACLYKKQTTATVTLSESCTDGTRYYGTYSNGCAFVVPEGLTVSAVGVDSEGKLEVMDYNTGDVVKANTGVMVSSTTSGDHTVALSSAEGTEISGNLLMASGDGGITAEQMAGAKSGSKYYRLTMHNGSDIGFWWGNASGAAFDLGANKAYLAVPETSNVREGFSFFGNEDSGIAEIVESKVENERIYDLQGRRVSKATRGMYIVNGRVVMK